MHLFNAFQINAKTVKFLMKKALFTPLSELRLLVSIIRVDQVFQYS